jgi:hypothetical protein
MANINKFSPVSPDTFLKAEKDMALAKFGHLNAIVDAYNTLDTAVTAISSTTGTLKANTIVESTSGSGVTITSQRSNISTGNSTATITVTAGQSGTTIILDKVDGNTVNLPASVVGLTYNIFRTAALTSGTSTVNTNGTDVFKGAIVMKKTTIADNIYYTTANKTITETYTTVTAGLVGSMLTVTCVSAGTWIVSGVYYYSGTVATPLSS